MPFFKKRRINIFPNTNYFKPAGIRLRNLRQVTITIDEYEAIRLKDLLEKDQKESAKLMKISQSTFHRIIASGRKKIADALINGKAIKIEGGNIIMEKKLKIAISATSDNLEKDIDKRFARCAYFLIVTLDDKKITDIKVIKNEQKEMQGGAGIAISEMIAKQNVDAIITGNIGPRALDILNQFNIAVYQFTGSIKEAINNFNENKLTKIN